MPFRAVILMVRYEVSGLRERATVASRRGVIPNWITLHLEEKRCHTPHSMPVTENPNLITDY